MDFEIIRSNYRDNILTLAKKHKLTNVRIFGSVARGEEHANSDIDILVHLQEGCSLLDLSAFEVEISELLGGQKIDVLDDSVIKFQIAPYVLSGAIPL